ncbi:MAG: uracil-DNA glycosylase, partial [Gammaproteobacteria bacterium]|nr:uracil-DNA glycosylase [Gammaproteobacteria bacterium]
MMTQNLKNEYLQAMGVQRWLVRTDGEDAVTDGMQVPANDIAEPVARDWAGLQQQVSGCKKCKLHETRTQTVFGVGNQQ